MNFPGYAYSIGDIFSRLQQQLAPHLRQLPLLVALAAAPFSHLANSTPANSEDARAVARLYSAAFDREPLPGGLNFWIDSIEQGQTLAQIAARFRNSPEFGKKYGALNNREFVEQLYRNILGREGAESGITFWLDKLESGNSQALVLRQFSESPENRRKTDDLFGEMHQRADGVWTYDPFSGEVKSIGTIDGFGSIFVNGVEFDTDDASIFLDGRPATEDALHLGMVVTVDGVISTDGVTGTARTIIFDDEIQGPVTTIVPGRDGDSLLITILGFDVIVERTSTVFDDVSFESLTVGDVLEVSGFADNEGRLRATRVEKKSGEESEAGEVELKGIVSALDGTEFMLGAYVVDFSGANLSGIPGGTITEGMGVEVHGTLADNRINADRVEEEDDVVRRLEDKDEVRVQGTIASFVSSGQFEVNGVSVDGSSALLRPSGLVLENGAIVQVEGDWDGGILVARRIESRRGRVEIEATVLSVDATAGTVTLQLQGVSTVMVRVDARTLLDDDIDDDSILTLETITAGDFLEVEAIQDGNILRATRIDRDDMDDEILQAPVDSFDAAARSIILLGITYSTEGAEFESRAGNPLSAEAFFAALQVGDLVKVKDKNRDGVADEVEFKRQRALDGDDCESDDDCDISDEDDSDDDSDEDDSDDDSDEDDSDDDADNDSEDNSDDD
jgi:hypothetical protein